MPSPSNRQGECAGRIRSIGRSRQIDYADPFDAAGNFDAAGFAAALGDTSRSLPGSEQHDWLASGLAASTASGNSSASGC